MSRQGLHGRLGAGCSRVPRARHVDNDCIKFRYRRSTDYRLLLRQFFRWLVPNSPFCKIQADPLYQHLILTAERKFWRCVESGEAPTLFGVEPPKPRLEAVRIVNMSSSNAWAEFAGIFARTRAAFTEHEEAKTELKRLMPEDAKEAIGHGVRARRSKSGAVSFDLLNVEATHAPVQ